MQFKYFCYSKGVVCFMECNMSLLFVIVDFKGFSWVSILNFTNQTLK